MASPMQPPYTQGPAAPNAQPPARNPNRGNRGPNWALVGLGSLALAAGALIGINDMHPAVDHDVKNGVETTVTNGVGSLWNTTSVVKDGEQGPLSSGPAMPEFALYAGTGVAIGAILVSAGKR